MKMSKPLYYYNIAYRDVKLNSIPSRNSDGSYNWTNGMEEILNLSQFNDLRKNYSEISQLEIKKNSILKEMLMYQHPTNNLEKEGESTIKTWQSELEDEQLNFKDLKIDLKQFDEDMFNRGHFIEQDESSEKNIDKNEDKKRKGINWKEIISFLAVWLIGELFMTYVQWSALRDDKGIEDLAVRSLAFAVTLFLLHYVAHLNKKISRRIYSVFMGFTLFMLLIMLFAPIFLNKLYPIIGFASSAQDAWSITNNTNAIDATTSKYPFWVEFYRSYEVTPAILCFLFYVAMISFLKAKHKEGVMQTTEPEEKPKTMKDEIREKRSHLKTKIKESEKQIEELNKKMTSSLISNNTQINNVLKKLQSARNEVLAADKRIAELNVMIKALLKAIEKELNCYQTEYLDILRNDSIKYSFITPVWPDKSGNDIIKYFNN